MTNELTTDPPASASAAPPPAVGRRRPWSDVPPALRESVERELGAGVVEALTQPGGFSPGVAARLRLADGSRAFVKAVGPEPNPDSPDIHRAEVRVARALPPSVPAPRLLADFDRDGWVVLLFEDIEGRPPAQPWAEPELRRVLDAVRELAVALTPSPIAELPYVADKEAGSFNGWRKLAAATGPLPGVDPWARRNLEALGALEPEWSAAAAGETLAHTDLRADNMLLTPDRVVLVDWPWACRAAPWFDLLLMLPSVRMQGGPPPQELFESHPVARGADPRGVTAVLAALAGMFTERSRLPDPPGLPTLRVFQAAQGRAALDWLRIRTGWA